MRLFLLILSVIYLCKAQDSLPISSKVLKKFESQMNELEDYIYFSNPFAPFDAGSIAKINGDFDVILDLRIESFQCYALEDESLNQCACFQIPATRNALPGVRQSLYDVTLTEDKLKKWIIKAQKSSANGEPCSIYTPTLKEIDQWVDKKMKEHQAQCNQFIKNWNTDKYECIFDKDSKKVDECRTTLYERYCG